MPLDEVPRAGIPVPCGCVSRLLLNPRRCPVSDPQPDRRPLDQLHRRLPGYAPSPLVDAPALADDWGVGRVLLKVEADRFGLPAFKVLGASWAVYRELLDDAGLPADTVFSAGLLSRLARGRTRCLVTATDGNHGRAVAWVARTFGLTSLVVVPAGTEQVRMDAIAGEGAQVVVADGDYDRACAVAAGRAGEQDGALLVQDTWWPGHETVPRRIAHGYSTLLHEVDDAEPGLEVDLLLVPAGVGSLAAAAAGHHAARPTRVVTVEPADAACLQASLAAGALTSSTGECATAMAGLNCHTPSRLAWPLLSTRLDGAADVTDEQACEAMRLLAREGVRAGATGAAGVAGARAVCTDPVARAGLGLTAASTVLVLVTEGVTDPAHFAAVAAGHLVERA